jgi:hypothetical protein
MHRPTYASVAATLALAVALGGTAYASGLPKNSVTSKQIKNNSVKSADLKNDSVTGADVAEATLGQVPDAARLGGQPASNYAARPVVVSGPFDQSAPLSAVVPGYGTFSLICLTNSLANNADDTVRYSWDVTPLGADPLVFGSLSTAPDGITQAQVRTVTSTTAATAFLLTDTNLSATMLQRSADGSKVVQVFAAGANDYATPGCSGTVTVTVLK